jgi:hypothetical protein
MELLKVVWYVKFMKLTAITVTPTTPILDTPCSIEKIPRLTLRSGKGEPSL